MVTKYPDFIRDTEYMAMHSSLSESEQLQAMLQNLTRVHLLTAEHFDSFDEMIRAYLLAGIEIFGLETGIVSQVSDDGDYSVCDVVSPLQVLEKGQLFQLEDTYCREVVKSQKVLGFPEVGKLDYMNCHPVYQNLKLEAYLSAPIIVDNALFGTLNFTSTCPRQFGFSEHEHNLILLMANAIGAFILLRRKEERLVALNAKMKRFVGYVAHDLRNPLGAILGFVRLAEKANLDETRLQMLVRQIRSPAERALELVMAILENAAVSAGHLEVERQPVSVSSFLDTAIDAVNLYAQECGISINSSASDSQVLADSNRLYQCLCNLLINAIKYAPQGADITIRLEPQADQLVVTVINPIASPEQTSAELKYIFDKKLYTSYGFGQQIVHEVLKAHGTELKTRVHDNTYQASFTLPLI